MADRGPPSASHHASRARLVLLLAIVACHDPRRAATPAAPAGARGPEWPVPVRILVRGRGGELVAAGELGAGHDAALPSGDDWFVEPLAMPDGARAGQLADEVARHRVPGVALRGVALAPAVARALAGRDGPIALELGGGDLAADAAAALAAAPRLRRLGLRDSGVARAELTTLLSGLGALEVLDVGGTATDLEVVAAIASRRLTTLSVARTAVDDGVGEVLGRFVALEIVDLSETRAGDRTAAALAPLPIRELYLSDSAVTSRGAAALAPLAPLLRRLDLAGTAVRDDGVAWLGAAPALIELGLGDTATGDATLPRIRALTALEELDLARVRATAKALAAALGGLAHLRTLDLAGTRADDAVAKVVLGLPALEWLRLDDTVITDKGLAGVSDAATLRTLFLARTRVGDRGLTGLASLAQLREIGLRSTRATAATLAVLAGLPELTSVDVGRLPLAAADLTRLVAALPHLERVYLDGTRADGATIAALAGRPLRILHAGGTALDDDAVPALAALVELQEVSLDGTALGNAVATAIAAWPQLRVLSLAGTKIDERVLDAIAAHADLRALSSRGRRWRRSAGSARCHAWRRSASPPPRSTTPPSPPCAACPASARCRSPTTTCRRRSWRCSRPCPASPSSTSRATASPRSRPRSRACGRAASRSSWARAADLRNRRSRRRVDPLAMDPLRAIAMMIDGIARITAAR